MGRSLSKMTHYIQIDFVLYLVKVQPFTLTLLFWSPLPEIHRHASGWLDVASPAARGREKHGWLLLGVFAVGERTVYSQRFSRYPASQRSAPELRYQRCSAQKLAGRWMVSRRTARWEEWPVSRGCPRCRRAWAACWTRAAAPGEKWRGCTWRKPWSRTTWAEAGTTPTTCWPTSRPTWTPLWLSFGKRW